MKSLLEGRISGREFSTELLSKRREDNSRDLNPPCATIARLFWDVEDFEADDWIRGDQWFDEDELKRRIRQRLADTRAEFKGELG